MNLKLSALSGCVLVVLSLALMTTSLYAAPQMAAGKSDVTVTGCLQKGTEDGGFFLISTENKHWELYPDTGVMLADDVGKTVTLNGEVAHRTAAQEEKSQPHEKKEIGKKQQHADLHVSSVKVVSDTCTK